MKNENKIVHGLWIGHRLSKLELLTLHSFVNNGHVFFLWIYNTIETPVPDGVIIKDANEILPAERVFRYRYTNQFGHGKGSLGGFSDIFRYKLLYEYGGWWTDMDVCCLKPLDFEEPYVFRTHHDLELVGNIMKCPRESELMVRCYEQASLEVDEDNRDWHKPIEILNNHVKQLGLTHYIKEFSNPDSWNYIRILLFRSICFPGHWYAVH
ncbi:MAG: hypothetical protein KJ607_02835, partial [Bacteroidetes bacterium]|nr:hypothetical protein [Bacteroidota bacterium]